MNGEQVYMNTLGDWQEASKKAEKKVFAVTIFFDAEKQPRDLPEEPVVTVFDNEGAAESYAVSVRLQCIGDPRVKVITDEVPLYHTFLKGKDAIKRAGSGCEAYGMDD